MTNVFLHLHPVKIRKSGIRLKFTWCMGGLTFFLFLVETFTGLLLMFYYRPTVAYAYMDIIDLAEQVPLGIMREIHRWGAHAMVISVWLHMFRVFMTGSYKPPREFNWNVGVILLVLTLLLSFTGYLLPWDQLAIWAITVGSNMARATPLLGHEGPGCPAARLRRREDGPRGVRRALRPPGRALRRRGRAAALLRPALRGDPARGRHPDGRPLLARPQGRRDLGPGVRRRCDMARRRRLQGARQLPDRARRSSSPWRASRFFAVARAQGLAGRRRVALRARACSPPCSSAVSMLDPNFALIVKKPDNIPIVAMLFLVGFFLWLSHVPGLSRTTSGSPAAEAAHRGHAGEAEKTWVWPDLVYTELLCMVIGMIILVVWGLRLQGAHRGAGQPRPHPEPQQGARGTSWASRRCSSTSIPGWRASCFPSLIIVGPHGHPLHRHQPEGQRLLHLRASARSRSRSSCSAS